tara:strand:+ start:171 stop:875 length:705 start_codon:yes stop_codon:yes gene_type:complete
MDWRDEGIVLSLRKHGESAVIVHLLTQHHGRHAGLVRGGNSTKMRGVLQQGNELSVKWHARLEDHLGSFAIELQEGHAARVLSDPGRLSSLLSACALADLCLPEREPHPDIFATFQALLLALPDVAWDAAYVAWELSLLAELGFGLDLSTCAASGATTNLIYVSPKSGRAVSAAAGEDYKDKLLPLPQFLVGKEEVGPRDIADGLRLTGYFLDRHILAPHAKLLPDARARIAGN